MARNSLTDEANMLLDLVDQDAGRQADRHQRQSPRFSFRREAKLEQVLEDGSAESSWIFTRDISAGGVGCLSPAELPLGAHARLWLPGDDQEHAIDVVVTHCRSLSSEWHLMGLRCERPIDPDRYVRH